MKKRIIKIDEDKCVGCGLCANACRESAIEIVEGKAKLMREDHCDGLGNCLPVCPTEAISFEERTAEASAVVSDSGEEVADLPCGCPGTNSRILKENERGGTQDVTVAGSTAGTPSQLMQWPVQIDLVPVNAPYFDNADLLIAADCSAYAYGGFHDDIMKDRITIIGCPKLDATDYSEKLTEIIRTNNIKSVTVARMEVPCCGGIQDYAETAIKNSGKPIPSRIITLSTDGKIVSGL